MEVDELMKCMLNLFNNTDKALKEANEKLSEKDMELSDLDHYLELNNLKASQYVKISRLRKTLREERRIIKNNIDMLMTIKRFTDKYNNKLIVGDILQNIKLQEDLKQRQDNPIYTYRTTIIEKLERGTNSK